MNIEEVKKDANVLIQILKKNGVEFKDENIAKEIIAYQFFEYFELLALSDVSVLLLQNDAKKKLEFNREITAKSKHNIKSIKALGKFQAYKDILDGIRNGKYNKR